MTDFTRANRNFDIGRVFNRTFGAVGTNFPVLFGLSVLLNGVPQGVLGVYRGASGLGASEIWSSPDQWVVAVSVGLLSVVCSFALQAAIVHGSVLDMNGRKARFADCLATGIRHFLPVLAISLLTVLALVIGLVVLILPAMFLAILFVVTVPVRGVENRGVFKSFSRSADLTKGSRWMILALFVVYLLLSWVFSAVAGMVLFDVSALFGGGIDAAPGSAWGLILNGLMVPMLGSISAMMGAAGVAAVYHELRSIKEGLVPEELASIFG
ncbi:MAG: hypothetical protein QE280_09470 [Caulobacter sp.]|nr:hypothetical protein [Caulobacter sp.]